MALLAVVQTQNAFARYLFIRLSLKNIRKVSAVLLATFTNSEVKPSMWKIALVQEELFQKGEKQHEFSRYLLYFQLSDPELLSKTQGTKRTFLTINHPHWLKDRSLHKIKQNTVRNPETTTASQSLKRFQSSWSHKDMAAVNSKGSRDQRYLE